MDMNDPSKRLVIDDWVRLILDSLYDGILIINAEGLVVYVNPSYTRITGVAYREIIGRRLSEARPGSLLTDVMDSGIQRLGVRRSQGASEYIVNMVPITRQGIAIGGISLLNEVNDVFRLVKELDRSNRMIRRLQDRVSALGGARYSFDDIVSVDTRSVEMKALAERLAAKGLNTLITGESGSGKELFAQSMHNASDRRNQPFLAINCASLEAQLLESELFGYEEGAFTGASKGGKVGIFEAAHGGTVFLDEIAELDYRLQAKLLRALQENRIRPVGGSVEIPIDIRVIAATNKDLEQLANTNLFRRDLFYRISVFTLHLCPLRERRDDIEPLINRFLMEISTRYRSKMNITKDALAALASYDWPGNVRELKNTLEYAVMMSEEGSISADDLPPKIRRSLPPKQPTTIVSLAETCLQAERIAIRNALTVYGDSLEGKRKAAEALGVSLSTLYSKLRTLD